MKVLINTALLALLLFTTATLADDPSPWSWNKSEENIKPDEKQDKSDDNVNANYEYDSAQSYTDQSSNDTVVDEVIDAILASGRQGRNLDGLDDVYSDPSVQKALEGGNDLEARNLIKDKLCALGLMDCNDPKRPFLSPDDLIYAQPVAIRPFGRPIATVPVRGGPPPSSHRGPYGPPKPMPPPLQASNNNFGPPRKVGYASSKPGYPGSKPSYINGPPTSSFPSYNGPPSSFPSSGPVYSSKPPGPIYDKFESDYPPYEFESSGNKFHSLDKPVLITGTVGAPSTGDIASASSLQQHVHHHYHHIDESGTKTPTVIVNNPIPVSSSNGLSTSEFSSAGFQSSSSNNLHTSSLNGFQGGNNYQSGSLQSGFGSYQESNNGGFSPSGGSVYDYKGFKGVNSGLGPVNGVNGNGVNGNGVYGSNVKPIYEGSSPNSGLGYQGPATFGSNSNTGGLSQSNSGLYSNTNSFHSSNPDVYKKELNVNGGTKYNGLSSYQTASYNGLYSNQNNNNNNNQFNTGESYQGFETSRQENYDCTCVPFDQCSSQDIIGRKDDLILPLDPRNLGSDIEALSDEAVITDGNGTMTVVRVPKSSNSNATVEKTEEKKITKRDVSSAEKKSDDDQEKANIEPRLLGYGGNGGGGNGGNYGNKKVVPTFGVSFGLPYPAGYPGYPVNPYGQHPGPNPYFGSISPNGLNLGLVNVNPLVSIQLTKNEYGEKLLKPLVNLHVTPNEHIIQKVGSFLHHKKHGIKEAFNKHQHYHQHTHYPPPPPIYHPHHHNYHDDHHYSHTPPPFHHHSGPEYTPFKPHHGYGFANYRDTDGPVFDTTGAEFDYNPSFQFGRNANATQNNYEQQNYNNNDNINSQYNEQQNNYDKNQYNYQSFYAGNDFSSPAQTRNTYANDYDYNQNIQNIPTEAPGNAKGGKSIKFPNNRRKRNTNEGDKNINDELIQEKSINPEKRQAYYPRPPQQQLIQKQCGPRHVCCRRGNRQPFQQNLKKQCGTRNAQGINGRIKTPVYVDGDSEFGEYPWQAAILKKDPKESVYVCGGTLIDNQHIITAAHCVKTYTGFDLRVRLGEWDVNHDVEFYPYIERDVIAVQVHPEYYAGTLDNDIAILRLDRPVDLNSAPHISPACMPDKYSDFTGARCWTTGWGKDAFGDYGKYQNILKEVDVPIIGEQQCQAQLRNTRLGYSYNLHPGFICAGGEEGKDACKGDGGGPLVCERGGSWQLVGVVSWGIGCGQVNVPGVYVKVAYYLDWINSVTKRY